MHNVIEIRSCLQQSKTFLQQQGQYQVLKLCLQSTMSTGIMSMLETHAAFLRLSLPPAGRLMV